MFKILVFVYLMGQPVYWETPVDFYTLESCLDASEDIINTLGYTVVVNDLNKNNDLVIQSWCVRVEEQKI